MSPSESGLTEALKSEHSYIDQEMFKARIKQFMEVLFKMAQRRPHPGFKVSGLTEKEMNKMVDGELITLPEGAVIEINEDETMERYRKLAVKLAHSGTTVDDLKRLGEADYGGTTFEEASKALRDAMETTAERLKEFGKVSSEVMEVNKVPHRNDPMNPHFKQRKNWKQKRKRNK